ncbi:MAG: UDP-2,3-diacylglucosamine diphosphatase LpxI [Bacteroidota bacterium]|nr:UDP-2,3-diacylglucosamine diphosphatase LpxI [Bacteroidota bacterium]
MTFIILFSGILLLILLITWFKLNAFLSFLVVSLGIGFAKGMSVTAITDSIQKGMGDLLGSLVVILVIGAMLGKLIADNGAAQRIISSLMQLFGKKYIVWALVITAFIVGIPLFYGIGFVLLVPLVVTLSYKYDIPAVYIGLPMLAALSVTHGYLPPHPSPVALVRQYHADLGLTLLYGFIAAVPAIIIAGPLFSMTLKKYKQKPLITFAGTPMEDKDLPGLADSLITALLPVILIGAATIVRLSGVSENIFTKIIIAAGDPIVALLLTLAYALYALVLKKGKKLNDDALMLGLIEELETENITVLDQSIFVKDLMVPKGVIGKYSADEKQMLDIEYGFHIAKEIGKLDLGQTVVAQNRMILAVETIEGTDRAVERGCRLGSGAATVVKVSKPNQDNRFDIPTVGMNTLKTMKKFGGKVLAVEANETFIVEKEKMIEFADKNKIVLIAV